MKLWPEVLFFFVCAVFLLAVFLQIAGAQVGCTIDCATLGGLK